MITRIRLLLLVARPNLVLLFGLFTAVGTAEAGAANDPSALGRALVVVVAFVVCSVIVNDLSDTAIDRINLAGDARRPLVTNTTNEREFALMGVTAGVVALVASVPLGWPVVAVVGGGLALSAGYSLRPVRIADRGALASLLLPAGYVAVPYFVGLLGVRASVTSRDLILCAGLYVGFIGRILLKDFRDVRGDSLLGKRTFLVRHGRRATCAISTVCWVAGVIVVPGLRGATPILTISVVGLVVLAVALLRALSIDRGPHRDDFLVAAIAIVGRTLVVLTCVHLAMVDAAWSLGAQTAVIAAVTMVMAGQATVMARRGPVNRHIALPSVWTSREPVEVAR